jgi:4-amino-4-deoxy-L-arabinose transferase-like glycosyltransferase
MASERFSFLGEAADTGQNLKLLRAVFWLVTIAAGFLQAWAVRFWISPDGNNYLDVASAYLRGDWTHAINAYWSPLFSWLLALCLWVFRPSPNWESTLLHLLNFAGLLLALRSFEFFFRAFLHMQKQFAAADKEDDRLSDWTWWALGYGLFLSTALFVQTVSATTPDIWVAALTFLIFGLILRIWTQGGGWLLFAALGLALACAYLTKTFYFPMTFVLLPTAWLATGSPRKTLPQAILATTLFVLFAAPWITILSHTKNRVTFGDVGKLNFAMMIDQIPQPFFWQGEDATGIPKHPVRQLQTNPRLFEFAAPIGGTYPPAYDTSYWMDGVRPHFSLRGMLRVLRQSGGTYFQIWTMQLEYGVALLFFFFLAYHKSDWRDALLQQSYLWIPPLVGCAAYAIVHVEFRLVAPFVPILWLAAFSCLLGSAVEIPPRVVRALILAVLAITGLRVAKSATTDIAAILAKPQNTNWQIAEGLRGAGLHPGDKIATLSLNAEVHWARLAGVQIVSEIPLGDGNIFWTEDPEVKTKVFHLFVATGAKMVVTKDPPLSAEKDGWIPLADTGFYAYRLPPNPH